MSNPSKFNDVKEVLFPTLAQYVPIVARVHGENHPEFHEVYKLVDAIMEKANAAGAEKPDLDKEFNKLRAVSDDYTVPGDVCESYEAVYKMLAELDATYHA
ncbi:regulator of cell morphogenesis and NO signaling [Trichococcus patagoniensis]|uniref:Regulator of cell morphogenesis and NO signaling n=1 Tax=Trichococcus patagoniensis TaxID=382641 RepID=A0A2T5IEF3_9LACT|nr:iron-sulfur cluster repair di-iron protein, ric [Trichococcus patagoniensis]PTQ82204.1 regulator of cell morphogenesis and NO signaling [Trichococcus patagoniensis]